MQLPGVGPRAFLRVAQIALVLVVLNIVTGGAVRLTDSGLGCPDWPTCSRHHLTPPLSFHPAVEFGNRLVVVALCFGAAVALVAAFRRRSRRRDLSWLAGGLVAGVVGEAVLGGIVVYTKLNPYVVMTHFLVGMALLTDAAVLALRAGRADPVTPGGIDVPGADRHGELKVGRPALALSRVMIGVLALAVAAGTATTASGPHAGGKGAKRLPVALADTARVHSGIVLVLVALTLVLLYVLAREAAPPSVTDRARVLLAAMIAQGAVGYTQYFSHLPALLVGIHVLGVTAVWVAMLWFHDGLRWRVALAPEHAAHNPAPLPGEAPRADVAPVPR